ncbi:MAG: hypothetical protein AUJ06_00670 [Chloroflexi bacterium 13_1_40CM_3_70_6]|nr:MAG: hypothetical protein AUJ06_00670 [Chloroflexi bacterium 13_1_40CM_3_70_6]
MASPTYVLIHVFGTFRDEVDREGRGKQTHSGWLREYVTETPQRLTEIARLLDLLTENGWKVVGSPYDCDVMLQRDVTREQAEQDIRRAEFWDRLVRVASADDDGHIVWREHPEGQPTRPRRRRRVRRPPTPEQGS